MSDSDLNVLATAGEITLILKHGDPEEVLSLLCAIEQVGGIDERIRLERWIEQRMPGA